MLLNGNVGFLAIQSVDNSDKHYLSGAQIASYLSIVASVGSILLGLKLLLRQRKSKLTHKDDILVRLPSNFTISYFADSNQRFNPNGNNQYLEIQAILHSLPYALLMWA